MGNEIRDEVGLRIAQLREARGLSQKQLSDELEKVGLKVRRETVTQWEAGTRDLKTEYTVKLADFFGVTCDEILRGIKSENLSIAKETGLSNGAITKLRQLSQAGERPGERGVDRYGYTIETLRVLSALIESNHFHELLNNMGWYLISAGVLPNEAYKSEERDLTVEEYSRFYGWAKGRGLEVIPRNDAKELYLQKACDILKDICKEMLEHGKHSREKE